MKMTGWLPDVQDWIAARYESTPKWLYHLSLGILSKFPPCCIAYFLMFEIEERGDWNWMHDECSHRRVLCWFHHKLCRNVNAANEEEMNQRIVLDSTSVAPICAAGKSIAAPISSPWCPRVPVSTWHSVMLFMLASSSSGTMSEFNQALEMAFADLHATPLEHMTPKDTQTWARLVEMLPDMLAAYYDNVERVDCS
jgi:hypothetical protein